MFNKLRQEIIPIIAERIKDKYYYWRFCSYSNKLDKIQRKEDRKKYGWLDYETKEIITIILNIFGED